MNHLYEIATGRLISSSQLDIAPLTGFAVVIHPDGDEAGIWNVSTLSFDARPPVRYINKQQFLDLFTDAELQSFFTTAKTNGPVNLALEYIRITDRIDLKTQRMIRIITILANQGVLTTARAQEIANG